MAKSVKPVLTERVVREQLHYALTEYARVEDRRQVLLHLLHGYEGYLRLGMGNESVPAEMPEDPLVDTLVHQALVR